MSSRGGDTRPVEPSFGRARLEAAQTFRIQATLTTEHMTTASARQAAASSAALAAIAAADAACAGALGMVWKGEHTKAHTLLASVTGGRDAANALKRIVASKTQWQYLERAVTDAALSKALRQADTVIDFAESVMRGR